MVKLKKLPTNRIAHLRAARGMTQQTLADLVGSHWITISKLERGKMRLTDEWQEKISEALAVDPSDLLPADRVLTTISIEGEIFPSGEISYYNEDDPHTNTIYNSLFHNEGLVWLYVNTDALQPSFKDGDVLGFRMAWGLDPSAFADRICLFWIGPNPKTVVGRVTNAGAGVAGRKKVTIATLTGNVITDVNVFNFAPLKIVIADLSAQFTDEHEFEQS